MKRTIARLRTPAPKRPALRYQARLHALWEDRWMLLGGPDRAAWLRRYRSLPRPANPPGTSPLVRALRRLLDGCPELPLRSRFQHIRNAL